MKNKITRLAALAITAVFMVALGPNDDGPEGVRPMTLTKPVRIATNGATQLVVSEDKSRSVVMFQITEANSLKEKRRFVIHGRPGGVAAFDGRVYVGNTTLSRIEIYNSNGRFKGILADGAVSVGDPMDFAIDETLSRLYVVDTLLKNIKVFDLSVPGGQWIATIAGVGASVDLLQHPTGIALDTVAQEIYVADYGEVEMGLYPRVNVYGYDGTFKRWLSGKAGLLGYIFSKPQGLAVDSENHLFIVDGWQGVVVAVDARTGRRLATLGEYGTEPGQLKLPLDLVIVGEDKDVYVTNSYNGRVELYPEGGKIP